MSFTNTVYGKAGWEKKLTSDQRHKLGTRMAFADGRVYRYVKNAAVEIAAGRLVQAPATDTADDMDCFNVTAIENSKGFYQMQIIEPVVSFTQMQIGHFYTGFPCGGIKWSEISLFGHSQTIVQVFVTTIIEKFVDLLSCNKW